MRVISSQFFSGTKEMTRARIMRVNSRQKRVNQIRASFVKDARRQMRVDTRSLAGALIITKPALPGCLVFPLPCTCVPPDTNCIYLSNLYIVPTKCTYKLVVPLPDTYLYVPIVSIYCTCRSPGGPPALPPIPAPAKEERCLPCSQVICLIIDF